MKNELVGQDVVLRLLQPVYIQSYLHMFSDSVRKSLHVPSSQAEHEYLFERLKAQQYGRTILYCIFMHDTNQLIGAIEIRDPLSHRGQLYFWLHEDFWGKGLFQQALHLVLQEYFDHTGALFLNAYVEVDNKRSYAALKKIGFADVAQHRGPHGMQYELVLRKQ